jgi:hypothetical protein
MQQLMRKGSVIINDSHMKNLQKSVVAYSARMLVGNSRESLTKRSSVFVTQGTGSNFGPHTDYSTNLAVSTATERGTTSSFAQSTFDLQTVA